MQLLLWINIIHIPKMMKIIFSSRTCKTWKYWLRPQNTCNKLVHICENCTVNESDKSKHLQICIIFQAVRTEEKKFAWWVQLHLTRTQQISTILLNPYTANYKFNWMNQVRLVFSLPYCWHLWSNNNKKHEQQQQQCN